MKKHRLVYILISLALSVVLLALLFTQLETGDLARVLRSLFLPALFAYMAASLAGTLLRTWRYRLLFGRGLVRWPHLLLATFVRNSFVDLLPARAGSLSFIYILNSRLSVPFETVTSVFVVSFVYDFLTLGPFVAAAVLLAGLGSERLNGGVLIALAVIFSLAWLAVLRWLPEAAGLVLRLVRAALRAVKRSEGKAARLIEEKFQATVEGLKAVRARKIDLILFAQSLIIRLAKYVSIYFLLAALLRDSGFDLGGLGFWAMILGMTGAEMTSALPVKGLAGFGTWETAWALTFTLMGIDSRLAVVSGLGVHLLTNLFEYALGIASLLVLAAPSASRPKRGTPQA
ncbi:MAG: flippase-like domain-containing protein [Candidatus Aminicenantes bacterium]|nr:flippase-like domain-containing protein [Candidatus Aminicenantes bacterium]